MANELDELMDLDPISLTTENLDAIIAYHRKARANAEAGIKPAKEKGPKVDLSGVLSGLLGAKAPAPKPATGGLKRRV